MHMHFYNENIQNQSSYNNNLKYRICLHCGQKSNTVFVHGHEQCVVCKNNVEPCCQGQKLKCG